MRPWALLPYPECLFPIALALSIRSYCLRLSDPVNPVPGPSQGGDSIVPFLYRLVMSSGASPLVTSGADGVRHGEGFGVTRLDLGASLPPSCFPSSSSAFTSGSSLPLASPVAPLAPSVTCLVSSVPGVSGPVGIPSSSVVCSLPPLSSLALAFPFSSPSVTSISSSLPLLPVSEALFCLCRGTNIYNFLACDRISGHVPRLFILFNFS